MDYISIGFIIIFVILVIVGLCKGFVGSLLGFIKKFAAIIFGWIFSKPVGELLFSLPLANKYSSLIVDNLSSRGGVFTFSATEENIKNALTNLKIPSSIQDNIVQLINKLNLGSGTIAESLGPSIVYYCCIIFAFAIIYILVSIIVGFIKKKAKNISKKSKALGTVDVFLGGILYAFFALLVIGLINYVLGGIISLGGNVANYLEDMMQLNTETFTISKWLYNNNLFTWFISFLVKIIIEYFK